MKSSSAGALHDQHRRFMISTGGTRTTAHERALQAHQSRANAIAEQHPATTSSNRAVALFDRWQCRPAAVSFPNE
jgi:hypothetical protein